MICEVLWGSDTFFLESGALRVRLGWLFKSTVFLIGEKTYKKLWVWRAKGGCSLRKEGQNQLAKKCTRGEMVNSALDLRYESSL